MSGNRLLDPTADALDDGLWSGVPTAPSNDFVLIYKLSLCTVCSGQDWNDGAPTKRWTQKYDGRFSVLTRGGLAGNTDKRAALMELSTNLSAKKAPIVIVSLADGSLLAEWPVVANNQRGQYIPADDGWTHAAPESAEAPAVPLTGKRIPFPLAGSNAALLVAEKGKPTIEQFRVAYEAGDVGWTRVVIDYPSGGQCPLSGNPFLLPKHTTYRGAPGRTGYQLAWSMSSDGRNLFMRPRGLGIRRAMCLVDIPGGKDISLTEGSVMNRDTVTPPMRDDLVIAVEDSSLVGYRPR